MICFVSFGTNKKSSRNSRATKDEIELTHFELFHTRINLFDDEVPVMSSKEIVTLVIINVPPTADAKSLHEKFRKKRKVGKSWPKV